MRLWITINGCVVGFFIGILLGAAITQGNFEEALIFAILGTVLGGWLAYKMYLLGVFLICLGMGFGASLILLLPLVRNPMQVMGLCLVISVVVGILGICFVKPVIVIITGVGGGLFAGKAAAVISGRWAGILIGSISILAGFWYQCKHNGELFGIGKSKLAGEMPLKEPVSKGMEQMQLGFQNVKNLVEEKINSEQIEKTELPFNSKARIRKSFRNVHVGNERELWRVGTPVIVTQLEVVDLDENGVLGVYLGFQNIKAQNIIAIYVDIFGYNVLKERKAELRDVCFLDLNISEGQVYVTPNAIILPDNSIRRCEVFIRHIVFQNEEIWTNEREESVQMIIAQNRLELSELNEDFERLIDIYMPKERTLYQYEPVNQADYWCCACGQLNEKTRGVCLSCKIRKEDIFRLTDSGYLRKERDLRLERERKIREEMERQAVEEKIKREVEKERRQAEIRMKIDESYKKTLEVAHCAKELGTVSWNKIKKGTKRMSPEEGASYCPNCGELHEQGDRFCAFCGFSFADEKNNEEIDELKI